MSLSQNQIETLIFGTQRLQRFTQDSPVLPDVWIEYNKDPGRRVDLLLTPYRGGQPAELFKRLRQRLLQDNEFEGKGPSRWDLTYNESYVVASLTFREMVRSALPLTRWWIDYVWPEAKRYEGAAPREPEKPLPEIEEKVDKSPARSKLEILQERLELLQEHSEALVNLIERRRSAARDEFEEPDATSPAEFKPSSDLLWMIEIVGAITLQAGRPEKPEGTGGKEGDAGGEEALPPAREVVKAVQELIRGLRLADLERPLVWAMNRNRPAKTAIWKSSLAVKADAARLLFHIRCKGLRWAVIDSGIDAMHRAFRRRIDDDPQAGQYPHWQDRSGNRTRIVETYDFTRLRTLLTPGKRPRFETTDGVIRFNATDRKRRKELREVRQAVEEGRMLDWERLGALLRVPMDRDYTVPLHPHGTHVAGILAGDWRLSDGIPEDHDLAGMCPDLELVDMRVLDEHGQSDEFTVLAALQFVRYLNSNKAKPVLQGVNLSLSLHHNVMNYACGRTPVCEECQRLVNTGTVVVAAAGNEGHASFLTSKGSSDGYRDASITDPGNADCVITVGATHRNRPFTYGVSYFSSRGPTGDGRVKPDLVAPGEKITGPIPGDDLDTLDGTSMAAPHVSGAAALLMARHDELIGDPLRIKKILCDTATDLGRERFFQGHGLLDVLRALQSV